MTRKHHIQSPDSTARARQLRRDSTVPERILWGALRAGGLARLKFRRQHPIGPFVVDYYCHESRLVVELDGMSHDGRASEDARRTEYLQQQGLRVFRVTNDDVLADCEAVARGIAAVAGVEL
jgi:very-short-patch-repair endonuclease